MLVCTVPGICPRLTIFDARSSKRRIRIMRRCMSSSVSSESSDVGSDVTFLPFLLWVRSNGAQFRSDPVGEHGGKNDAADDDFLQVGVDVQQGKAVVQNADDQQTDERATHRSDAAR